MSDCELLRSLYVYDPETGILTWRISPVWNARVGAEAGTRCPTGYRYVRLGGKSIPAHRAIWCLVTGSWPVNEIDHKNGVRDDNRWCNLREATRQQQCGNLTIPRHNTSGYRGVNWHKQQSKWRAVLITDGKQRHLGFFPTPEAAATAYNRAAIAFYGEFARLNEVPA